MCDLAAAKPASALWVDCTSTWAAQLGDPELPGRARTFLATACRRDVHLGPPAPTAPPCGPCVDAISTGAPAPVSRWPQLGPDAAAYTTLAHHRSRHRNLDPSQAQSGRRQACRCTLGRLHLNL